MKIIFRRHWVRIQLVEFGDKTKISWTDGDATVDRDDQFEVLLTPGGGYDFYDRVPDSNLRSDLLNLIENAS